MNAENNNNQPVGWPWWVNVLIIIVSIVVGLIAWQWAESLLESPPEPTTEAEAIERMVGVWTYTGDIDFSNDPFPFVWVKWEIREDGTMTSWNASPVDNDWGEGITQEYEVVSGKYATNGKRWFGIEEPHNDFTVGVFEEGFIVLHMLPAATRKAGIMVRGDKNPFSK